MSSNLVPIQPPENILTDLVPVNKRKRVYAAFGLVGFLIGALVVGFFAAKGEVSAEALPTWLVVAIAVYGFATPFFSKLARDNAVPVGHEAEVIVAASEDTPLAGNDG